LIESDEDDLQSQIRLEQYRIKNKTKG
jgi:hypothetical protein